MGLTVKRDDKLESLFDKFAIDPDQDKKKKKEKDSKKTEDDKEKEQ